MINLKLLGEPKSTQNAYRIVCKPFGSLYMVKDAQDLKLSYQWQAKSQYKGKPLEGNLEIWVNIFFGTKRRADIDNFSKLLFDSLTGICWNDDSQIILAHFGKQHCKDNPRIELSIEIVPN